MLARHLRLSGDFDFRAVAKRMRTLAEDLEENKMDVSSSGKLDEALSEVVIDISDMNRGRVTVCSKEC